MTKKYQTGLSLIELMVALAISSFLILGVTQIYLDNKRSYVFQQNQAENLEGTRYALLILQQELTKASYRRRPDEILDKAFPASTAADCTFDKGETVNQVEIDAVVSICLRYQPRTPNDRDCLGNLPIKAASITTPYTSTPEIIVERIYLEGESLTCKSAHTDAVGTTIGTTQKGELLGGIADLRYEFGTGSSSDNRSIQQYEESTTNPILAIRYTALMRSSNSGLRDAVDVDTALKHWKEITGTENSDSVLAALKSSDKGQLYQVSQSTVMLRNLMP